MPTESPRGPGPLIWVVIFLAAVAGGIWGFGAALSVGIATTALFMLIGNTLENSAARKRHSIQDEDGTDDDPEILYYVAVENYLKEKNLYYDLVLPALSTIEFLESTSKVYKAGYNSDMSPKVVGAWIADAANLYNKSPDAALMRLQNLEKRIREKPKGEAEASKDEAQDDIKQHNASAKLVAAELSQFKLAVQERLREGPAGDSLYQIDQSFRNSSPEYLKITTELFQTAIDLGKSPTEVSTYLILAFAAAREVSTLEPSKRVTVYLRGIIDHLRSND